jgi:hypothetical protein
MFKNSDFVTDLMSHFDRAIKANQHAHLENRVWEECVEIMPALFTASVIAKRLQVKLDSKEHKKVALILDSLEQEGRVETAEHVQEGDVYLPLYRVCGA